MKLLHTPRPLTEHLIPYALERLVMDSWEKSFSIAPNEYNFNEIWQTIYLVFFFLIYFLSGICRTLYNDQPSCSSLPKIAFVFHLMQLLKCFTEIGKKKLFIFFFIGVRIDFSVFSVVSLINTTKITTRKVH